MSGKRHKNPFNCFDSMQLKTRMTNTALTRRLYMYI